MTSARATSGRSPVGSDGAALAPMGTDTNLGPSLDLDLDLGLGDNNSRSSARTNYYREGALGNVETAAKR